RLSNSASRPAGSGLERTPWTKETLRLGAGAKPCIRSPTRIEMSLPRNPFAKGPTSGRVGQLEEASGYDPRTNIPVASAPGRTEDSRCAQVWLGAGLDSAVGHRKNSKLGGFAMGRMVLRLIAVGGLLALLGGSAVAQEKKPDATLKLSEGNVA